MTPRSIHLGFEIGSGDPVEIPISHMAVFGQTQKSGKTTALEALITRASIPAIAFLTKRGEGGFQNARKILPYFKENADWHFVQTILESVMRQDQKFKQPWIIRACEGAKTLADVQRRAAKLEKAATHSMSQDMYMVVGEYLKKVVPIIAQLPKTNTVHLSPGLSVMDLIAYPFELQILVIASTLDWDIRARGRRNHCHPRGVEVCAGAAQYASESSGGEIGARGCRAKEFCLDRFSRHGRRGQAAASGLFHLVGWSAAGSK